MAAITWKFFLRLQTAYTVHVRGLTVMVVFIYDLNSIVVSQLTAMISIHVLHNNNLMVFNNSISLVQWIVKSIVF